MWVCVLRAADCKGNCSRDWIQKLLMLVLRYWYSNTGGKIGAVGAPGETFRDKTWGIKGEDRMGSYMKLRKTSRIPQRSSVTWLEPQKPKISLYALDSGPFLAHSCFIKVAAIAFHLTQQQYLWHGVEWAVSRVNLQWCPLCSHGLCNDHDQGTLCRSWNRSDGGWSSLLPQPQSVLALGVTLPLAFLPRGYMGSFSEGFFFPIILCSFRQCGPVDCRRSGFLSLSP